MFFKFKFQKVANYNNMYISWNRKKTIHILYVITFFIKKYCCLLCCRNGQTNYWIHLILSIIPVLLFLSFALYHYSSSDYNGSSIYLPFSLGVVVHCTRYELRLFRAKTFPLLSNFFMSTTGQGTSLVWLILFTLSINESKRI